MNWIVPGLSSRDFLLRALPPRLGRARCGIGCWRGPLFYQEAMPIRSRYQDGVYSPVQHHEVVAGQGRAVAGERGGGCAERRDPHHGVCRHDVVTGGVVRDRPACTPRGSAAVPFVAQVGQARAG